MRESFVYFIQAGEGGPIKIGTTRDPSTRLHALQTATPVTLRYIGEVPGDRFVEQELHARLRADRIPGGEWFRPTPAVLAASAEAERQMLAARAEAIHRWCSQPRIPPDLRAAPPDPAPAPRAPKRATRTARPVKQAEPPPSRAPRYATVREWLAARRSAQLVSSPGSIASDGTR